MALSIDQLMQLAKRAHLELSEREADACAADVADLERMSEALLPFFGSLGETDAEPICLSDMREDRKADCLPRERLLALSDLREDDCIAVPYALKEV